MWKGIMIKYSIFIIVGIILLGGCSYDSGQIDEKGGLKIYTWSSSIGSDSNLNMDKTNYSFSINLVNENRNDILVKSIEPILGDSVKGIVMNEEILFNVNKTVSQDENCEIAGNLFLDTKGMSKGQIEELEPIITDIKVYSEEIINLKENIKLN